MQGGHSWLLYVGQFSKGRRSGLGVAASSRGERLAGHWHEDVPWGPGVYTYAQPASPGGSHGETGGAASSSGAAAGARWRLRFEGILNGRPQGKGCMTWSDGSQEMGRCAEGRAGKRGLHNLVLVVHGHLCGPTPRTTPPTQPLPASLVCADLTATIAPKRLMRPTTSAGCWRWLPKMHGALVPRRRRHRRLRCSRSCT